MHTAALRPGNPVAQQYAYLLAYLKQDLKTHGQHPRSSSKVQGRGVNV